MTIKKNIEIMIRIILLFNFIFFNIIYSVLVFSLIERLTMNPKSEEKNMNMNENL